MRTTKGGPHGQVQDARNFISESGRPCLFHAARKRHDAIPIDNHAIYTRRGTGQGRKERREEPRNGKSAQCMHGGGEHMKRLFASAWPHRGAVRVRTWLDTPTRFCSHAHSWPFPMNEEPKHSALMLLVKSIAGRGTPLRVVRANRDGA